MAPTNTNPISAIAACLACALQRTKHPLTVIDSAGVAAGILPALLSYLSVPAKRIDSPFGKKHTEAVHGNTVLCIPPMQETLSVDEESASRDICTTLGVNLPRLTTWLFAALALYHAGPKGTAVVLMPQTSLLRSAWRMGQKDFIDRKLIEAVVTLPDPLSAVIDDPHQPLQHRPGTVAYDSLVVLNRPEERTFAAQIAFILPHELDFDVRKKQLAIPSGALIPYEDVVNNGYLLTPLRYREDRPTFSNAVRLREVATVTRGVSKARLRGLRLLTATSLGCIEPTLGDNAPVAYLTSKDFEHGYDYCYLASADMHPSSSYYAMRDLEAAGIASTTADSILLSRTGTPFKACRLGCASLEHPIGGYLFADNLYCIQPGERLDPDYLLAFFNSTAGQQALCRTANSASTMQQLSPNDLRDMLIPLPSVEQQRRIASRYLEQLNSIADMERKRANFAAERDRWFPRTV